MTDSCYDDICDQGQLGGVFIVAAMICNGILSAKIAFKECEMKRKMADLNNQERREEERVRKRNKMFKTVTAVLAVSFYACVMMLVMSRGGSVLTAEDLRSFVLVTVCIIGPTFVVGFKSNLRRHFAKKCCQAKTRIMEINIFPGRNSVSPLIV